jgi:hypothetical protein
VTRSIAWLTCFLSVAALAQMMDGKEVRRYEGVPNSINEQAGKIVIRTESSVGNWSIGPRTVVFFGAERMSLGAVVESTRVEAWVSQDGFVHRINILEMRLPPGPPSNYSGEVVSLNEGAGEIEVRTPNSVGHWKVGGFSVVGYRGHRIPLVHVLRSKRVSLAVTREGRVERIEVLEMK